MTRSSSTGQRLDALATQSRLVTGLRDCLLPVVRPRGEAGTGDAISLIGAIDGRLPAAALSVSTSSGKAADVGPPPAAARAPGMQQSNPRAAGLALPGAQPTADDINDLQNFFSRRFVMRMLDSPFKPGSLAVPEWQGAAMVVGNNAAADALRKHLAALGVRVRGLDVSDDLDATLAAFDALWRQEPLPHLFLMSERRSGAT